MKPPWVLICAATLLSTGVRAGGQDTPLGADLHAAHCTGCHSANIYTRPQRLVNSYAELRKRVRQCELSAELGWFDEEVDAVVTFLNGEYYKFGVEMKEGK